MTNDELVRMDERVVTRTLADGDRYGAMQHMMTVDGPCRATYRLLNPQGSTN